MSQASPAPIPREPLKSRDALEGRAPDRAALDAILAAVLARIDANLAVFIDAFPAPSSVGGVYPAMGNVEWTNGFWTGMLWLAYEVSGEARYRQAAERQVQSFKDRVDRRINVDHHDLGFLYSLSCVAAAGGHHPGLGRPARSRSGGSDDHRLQPQPAATLLGQRDHGRSRLRRRR
jgi:hypothetical protein